MMYTIEEGKQVKVGGWIPDMPDIRDHFITAHPQAKKFFGKVNILKAIEGKSKLPSKADVSEWDTEVKNQGHIGSCTANAMAYAVANINNHFKGIHVDPSRLFIYFNSRWMLGMIGQEGSTIRNTFAAGRLFGAPPELNYPYNPAAENQQPGSTIYAMGQNYQFSSYAKLSDPNLKFTDWIEAMKATIASGLPVVGGVTVYSSFMSPHAARTGQIPIPAFTEKVLGGHAICFVGYDDSMVIKSKNKYLPESKGAFKFINSWGRGWGDAGYGFIPYDYVKYGLASDIWTLYDLEWVDVIKEFHTKY